MQDNDLISRKALGIGRCNPDVFNNRAYGEGWNACIATIEAAPAVDAVPVVRCRDCKHKKLDGPSTCKSIVNEFYCDEKLEWHYQYEGEPNILDWFCADGERADAPTCGPDYCEIGGGEA